MKVFKLSNFIKHATKIGIRSPWLSLPTLCVINYTKFTLPNGLVVLHHHRPETPLVVLNILYNVGARDESPEKTGFAHLFEHLMFGGSKNIPEYDGPLQVAGGDNNAFTSNDITNYYLTIPDINAETGFWLESDRMLSLAFDEKSLEVQRGVVIEEFKQRYLNQPYGDAWLKLRPLAYKTHPYRWPTIGKEISHIETATMDDVKSFFSRFYGPNNAILVVGGNLSFEKTQSLCEKWFAPIPAIKLGKINLPIEQEQTESRIDIIEADVPANALYMAFHTFERTNPHYHSVDILADILSDGVSSRLYQELIQKKPLFSNISAYQTGDQAPGLFVIEGQLNPGTTTEQGELAVWEVLESIIDSGVDSKDVARSKSKFELGYEYGLVNELNVAMSLAYFEWLGDANLINEEPKLISRVTPEEVQFVAKKIFRKNGVNYLRYHARNNA